MSEELRATYVNHKGDRRIRRLWPQAVWFGSTEWHPNPQWLLRCADLEDDGRLKDFALAGFFESSPEAVRPPAGPVDRPTDPQPPPRPAKGDVWLLVLEDMRLAMEDMKQRRLDGISRYHVPVQVDNGRDHLVDAYQEALDLCVYLRAEISRRSAKGEAT